MYNNCTDKTGKVEIHHFFKSLVYCLEDEIPSHETTTEESYGYFGGFGGGMFDYGDDEVQKYPNVEELLKAIELDIEEILDSFSFGRHSFITPYMKKQDRKELFSMDWTTNRAIVTAITDICISYGCNKRENITNGCDKSHLP